MLLAQPGIEVNGLSRFNPLYAAVYNNRIEIVKLLLDQPKIDVNNSGDSRYNPLRKAIEMNRTEIAQLLRDAGAHE